MLPAMYDDSGLSGGAMDRPALTRLLADIAAGKFDTVVVYKVDRLTRSLSEFAKIVEVFERHGATFVSVTQSFNTTTSMGRLTLNKLLSFAQFEREIAGERIRDKIAASKKKGLWMGGLPPLATTLRTANSWSTKARRRPSATIFNAKPRSARCVRSRTSWPPRASSASAGSAGSGARPTATPFARRALPDAAEPDLPRRDRP